MNHSHTTLKDRFYEELRFFKGWMRKPGEVGAVKPTGREAARAMACYIPVGTDLPVLELGPGTGVITQAILDRGISPDQLVSIEFNRDFYEYLLPRFPGVRLIHGDALRAEDLIAATGFTQFSAVISAVPLLNLPKSERVGLIRSSLGRVAEDGPFVQISYGPRPPTPSLAGTYRVVAGEWIVKNVPPAKIFVYRRDEPKG
jgi:phosphatidylethanolamine/phosphatidyl-N-methylethanolamine N-methyltransferase